MANPTYGEVWHGNLDPTIGREQAGQRPLLIITADRFNAGPAGLAVIVPITSTLRNIPWHVPVFPPEGGLTRPSVIMCEAMRSVSQDRLDRYLGVVSPQTMAAVQDRLRILLNL